MTGTFEQESRQTRDERLAPCNVLAPAIPVRRCDRLSKHEGTERMTDTVVCYTANHGKTAGIEDYIDNLKLSLELRGYEFAVTTALRPGCINIVIDEFTNYVENYRIQEFVRLHKDTPVIFILTEFVEKRYWVASFNHFGGPVDSALLSAVDVYLRAKRPDFRPAGMSNYMRLLAFLPVLLLYSCYVVAINIRHPRSLLRGKLFALSSIGGRLRRLVYMHMRFLGCQGMIECADAVLLSHDKIADGLRDLNPGGTLPPVLGTLYSEFSIDSVWPNLLRDKAAYVEMTGSITKYRARFCSVLNSQITLLGMHHVFGHTQTYSFGQIERGKIGQRGAFSLHPPQSRSWKYCSPTRIYRALCVDGNVPLLTKRFGQHPIEALCLVYDGRDTILEMHELYTNRNALRKFVQDRCGAYLGAAKQVNDMLCEKLAQVADAKRGSRPTRTVAAAPMRDKTFHEAIEHGNQAV